MRKTFRLKRSGALLIALLILFVSFNSENPALVHATSLSIAPRGALTFGPDQITPLTGYLDTLWIDAATFNSLQKKKLTFRFYIYSLTSITMHGWYGKKTKFVHPTPDPDVKLLIGRTSDKVQYVPGNYFGNLVLYKNEIIKIKKIIKDSSSLYVLFAPANPADHDGQITYNILHTKDDPGKEKLVSSITSSTGITTNPSPPRNSN